MTLVLVTLTLTPRWLAVEALTDTIFSPASEVWALGVTLWEMFTLGNTHHNCPLLTSNDP